MPKPPIDPDSFDKVNFVIDAWVQGCDAPWYLYIETMKPALLAAFISLISFGYGDVLRGFARPKGLDKRRTKKRKGKWNKLRPRFPEIGNLIGEHIPGSKEVSGLKWSNGLKTLWRIDGVMQQALFWWLVADIVEEFAFAWTSLLFESYWCQPDPAGRFSYQHIGWHVFPNATWAKAHFGTEDYETYPPEWYFASGWTGPNPAQITVALRVRRLLPFDPPVSLQIRVVNKVTFKVLFTSDLAKADAAGDVAVPVSGAVPANTLFEVRIRMEGALWAQYGEGVIIGLEIEQ